MSDRRFHLPTVGSLTETISLYSSGKPGHIVDDLIAERSRGLRTNPFWPLMRPFLYWALHYRQAVDLADAIANMSAFHSLEYASDYLKLDLNVKGASHIPRTGGFMLVSNHPTGIADGIAMFDLLRDRRPDMIFFANRDAVRVSPRLIEMVIPVEWREEEKSQMKTRETLRLTNSAVREGRATVIFPSGRIAYWQGDELTERPWNKTAVAMAKRYSLPILPAHMSARNSGLFYLLSRISPELRDMTVFHELLNKKHKAVDITVGKPIDLSVLDADTGAITEALQQHCAVDLARDGDAVFAV